MPNTVSTVDMIGRNVNINQPVERIVCLVPSITELLFEIGLGHLVVGVTVFCVHPEKAIKSLPKVGGTKKVRMQAIEDLRPDLIICNQEENTLEMVQALEEQFPVWVSSISNLKECYRLILELGHIHGVTQSALNLQQAIQKAFAEIKIRHRYRCLYLIWRNPYMSIGKDTFIHHMLALAGFDHVIDNTRYPELSAESLKDLAIDVLLLSSEPYPFKDKHIAELQKLLPNIPILLVDGELFSWYGSRLLHSPAYFNDLQRQLHLIKR